MPATDARDELDAQPANPFLEPDLWAPVRRMFETIEWAADLMRTEAATEKPNPARVGAVRRTIDIERTRVERFAAVGALPRDPVRHFHDEQARFVFRRVLDQLRARGVDRDAIDEALQTILGSDSGNRSNRAPEALTHRRSSESMPDLLAERLGLDPDRVAELQGRLPDSDLDDLDAYQPLVESIAYTFAVPPEAVEIAEELLSEPLR